MTTIVVLALVRVAAVPEVEDGADDNKEKTLHCVIYLSFISLFSLLVLVKLFILRFLCIVSQILLSLVCSFYQSRFIVFN